MTPARPPPPRGRDRDGLRGLKPAQAQQLQRAMGLLASGQRGLAGLLLLDLAGSAPEHPEVLRCRGLWHVGEQDWAAAAAFFARAHALRPLDIPMRLQWAGTLDHADDPAGAQAVLRAAASVATTAAEWLALSIEHDRQGDLDGAHEHVQRALLLQPDAPVALLQRARCATARGLASQAADDCRRLIARGELVARAWFMLADLKVVKVDEAEVAALQAAAASPPPTLPADERLYLQFALGKALEDAGRIDEAFTALRLANDAAAAMRPWDAAAFQRQVAAVEAAFATDGAQASADQGSEVIFLVGLPRSGTTLVEQILASHSRVEGASELPYLGRVLDQESRRRGRPFPDWAASATADDWARMGRSYLHMSARWRAGKPVATDKLPENWLHVGAALRMLPGAHVVDCRRDPLETCWSCYKQLFGPGMAHFTYSFEGLAGYWHAYDRLARFWAERDPARVRVQSHDALLAAPEAEIRALLAACGLPFEAACMNFHVTQRAIRTPSALQVRQPLRPASRPAARYGERLAALRRLL